VPPRGRYRIHAHVELGPDATKNRAAYRDQFRRRVNTGACFQQPYLGTREFSAYFGPPDDSAPIPVRREHLGVMLHRVHHGPPVSFDWFTAELTDGVLHIPPHGITADLPLPVGVS